MGVLVVGARKSEDDAVGGKVVREYTDGARLLPRGEDGTEDGTEDNDGNDSKRGDSARAGSRECVVSGFDRSMPLVVGARSMPFVVGAVKVGVPGERKRSELRVRVGE